MTVTCVIQARMGSSRLPGKVLAEVGGMPMLEFMIRRLRILEGVQLLVATSDASDDDAVENAARHAGVEVVRGPEDDVLARFALAMDASPSDVVVRLTGDCPLSDPALVTAAVDLLERSGASYSSNTLIRTYPDGLDVEVIRADALRAAAAEATDPVEREHVTPFVYRRPGRFPLVGLRGDEPLGAERWTVDTAEDLEFVREVVDRLDGRPHASWQEVLGVMGRRASSPKGALTLRPAFAADSDFVLALRNDPDAVAFSGTGSEVTPEQHREWFTRTLTNPATRLWIAEVDGQRVGQVRVDTDDAVGTVSIAVDAEQRGSGHATAMLDAVKRALRADFQVSALLADVHPENVASQRLFERAGFVPVKGSSAGSMRRLRWERDGAA